MGRWGRDSPDSDREPDSTWADPLPGGRKAKDQQDADSEGDEVPECKFLEMHYVKEEGSGYLTRKIMPAGSAPPAEPPEPTTNEYGNFPLVLLTEYDCSGKNVQDRKLQVNSPALKAVIRRCLGDRYNKKWKCSATDNVEISWPWQDWFQGLDYFKREVIRLGEQIAQKINEKIERRLVREKETCKLLIGIIEKYHDSTIKEMNECLQQGCVNYGLLWTVFNSYQELYREKDGTPRAYEFVSGVYTCNEHIGKHYSVQCRYIDYDGNTFGWIDTSFVIPQFKGKVKITRLPIYPLNYHPHKEKIREELITRGKKFESLRGVHYMRYGPSLRGKEIETVAHRLMIDALESDFRPRSYEISQLDLDEYSCNKVRVLKEVGYYVGNSENTNKKRKHSDVTERIKVFEPNDGYEGDQQPYTPLPDFYCLLTKNAVGGFDLKNKRWIEVDVMHLTEPTWNTNAFDSLVLDEHKKELIKALVEQHIADASGENAFDDFIPGKGKGLIYILHGPPGVGKTLTAEAVSEYTKSPLYVVSAGELGTSSGSIESQLKSAFDLCARWNALMLLDEADVFMEARSLHDIDRNACVSVFLKVLEYYEGILFLTTNRVVSFDEAFRSRVHVTLRFEELNHSSRLKIWEAFINRIAANGMQVDISEEEMAKLAMKPLNGREIKNAVKLAHSLARKREGPLTAETVLQTVEIQEGFVGAICN